MSYQQAIEEANRLNGKGAKRENKYGAVKSDGPGIPKYDSKAERDRASELAALQRAGIIVDLERQQRFPLKVWTTASLRDKGESLVDCGTYIADFCYKEVLPSGEIGPLVVEDVKGVRTKEYILKSKLFYALYGVKITEISK